MLGLAVMAASVPGIHGSRAVAFVIAYVALRWYAGAVFARGKVLLDWPLAQFGLGALPWLISLWVDAPLRYWLWAVGIAIDLRAAHLVGRALDAGGRAAARARPGVPPRPGPGRVVLEAAPTEEEHLLERLGLFVIIVLGEGLIQIIDAAADSSRWDRDTAVVALGAFSLLASVWAAGLLHGTAGIPQLKPHVVAPRIVMVLHALLSGALAALAASLGVVVEHIHEPLPAQYRALLCGALAVYCAIGVLVALLVGKSRRWFAIRGMPSVVAPVVLILLWPDMPDIALVWLLVLVVLWLALEPPAEGGRRRRGPAPAATSS